VRRRRREKEEEEEEEEEEELEKVGDFCPNVSFARQRDDARASSGNGS